MHEKEDLARRGHERVVTKVQVILEEVESVTGLVHMDMATRVYPTTPFSPWCVHPVDLVWLG